MKTRLWCFLLLAATGLATEPRPVAVVAFAFINEHAPYPQCHASTIAEVAPGKLVAAWFGGTRERAPDVGIWLARQEDGRWLDAVEVANGVQPMAPGSRHGIPSCFSRRTVRWCCFTKLGRRRASGGE